MRLLSTIFLLSSMNSVRGHGYLVTPRSRNWVASPEVEGGSGSGVPPSLPSFSRSCDDRVHAKYFVFYSKFITCYNSYLFIWYIISSVFFISQLCFFKRLAGRRMEFQLQQEYGKELLVLQIQELPSLQYVHA